MTPTPNTSYQTKGGVMETKVGLGFKTLGEAVEFLVRYRQMLEWFIGESETRAERALLLTKLAEVDSELRELRGS